MRRILTLNLWKLADDWRRRREEIVVWIDHLDPDVVCLQEVVQDRDDPDRNTAAWIASRCGRLRVATVATHNGFGNAVLTLDAPVTHQSLDLPGADARDDIQRNVLHVRTKDRLDIYCTHLAWRFEEGARREQQVLAIDRFVRETADPLALLPPILAGDFNAEPDSAEIRFLTGLQSLDGVSTYWQDAWRIAGDGTAGYTWDNTNLHAATEHEPDRRIDYVFVGWRRDTGAGVVKSCRVTCDHPLPGSRNGVQPSDHYGVVADIAT